MNAGPYANGMALRDWFAGQALPQIIANVFNTPACGPVTKEEIAWEAYEWADAMCRMRHARVAEAKP